jgi:regulator of protease activity HflC (stomatin/prohibitin superfamily)
MFSRRAGTALGVVVLLVLLSGFFGAFYTVDQSERAVLTTNGAYTATASPGLHFKVPFFQGVTHISIQQRATRWDCDHEGAACMQAYSRDQQPADLRVSVIWHALPDRMEQVYTQYGGDLDAVMSRLISPKASQAVKTVFGQYTAVSAVQNRAQFNATVNEAVRHDIDTDAPIVIDSVQVENIDYSDAYEQSVEARMLAEVEVQKRTQELEQQKIAAQITVTQAQAQADSQLAVARANAEATRIQGEATAAAIKARGDALRDNPGLVALTQAERWNGVLPVTMVPNGAVPMLDLTSALRPTTADTEPARGESTGSGSIN